MILINCNTKDISLIIDAKINKNNYIELIMNTI